MGTFGVLAVNGLSVVELHLLSLVFFRDLAGSHDFCLDHDADEGLLAGVRLKVGKRTVLELLNQLSTCAWCYRHGFLHALHLVVAHASWQRQKFDLLNDIGSWETNNTIWKTLADEHADDAEDLFDNRLVCVVHVSVVAHAVLNEDISELKVLLLAEFAKIVACSLSGHRDSEDFAHLLELRGVTKLDKLGFQLFDGKKQEGDQVAFLDELFWRGSLDMLWVYFDSVIV